MTYIKVLFFNGFDQEAYQCIEGGQVVDYKDESGNSLILPNSYECIVLDESPEMLEWM